MQEKNLHRGVCSIRSNISLMFTATNELMLVENRLHVVGLVKNL